MKKNTLVKVVATVALIAVTTMGLFAQVTGTGTMVAPTGNDVTDSVTIGSVMPYQVTGDLNMHKLRAMGILNYSQFTTAVSAGGTKRAISGASGSTPAPTDSAISVAWAALGVQSVSFTEVPQVVSGPAYSCTANTQTLNVTVLARPTVVWNGAASASGCGVDNTTVTLPFTAAGTGQYDIKYKITYTNLSGVATPVVPSGTALTGIGPYANGSANLTISYAVPAGSYGKYDVVVENVTDRISRKSGVLVSQPADLPAAALTFYAYPTPQTQPIQHFKNL